MNVPRVFLLSPSSVFGRLAAALLVLSTLASPGPVLAQEGTAAEDSLDFGRNPYGSGVGLEVVLTNSGFGFGGYWNRAVTPSTSLMAEVILAPGKDEREFKFLNYFRTSIPNKANYLVMLPVQVGIQRRLFREQIEDNFRPYVQATAGPTIGWEYPYFRDCNGDGTFDRDAAAVEGCEERTYDPIGALWRGNLKTGVGGGFALGASFGTSKRMAQSVRVGYAFTYFFEDIQLLEPGVAGAAQRFFGTPSISLMFGRLF